MVVKGYMPWEYFAWRNITPSISESLLILLSLRSISLSLSKLFLVLQNKIIQQSCYKKRKETRHHPRKMIFELWFQTEAVSGMSSSHLFVLFSLYLLLELALVLYLEAITFIHVFSYITTTWWRFIKHRMFNQRPRISTAFNCVVFLVVILILVYFKAFNPL